MKLDIGAGDFPKDGYTTVDPFTGADIQAPMWDIPLPDNSIDEIVTDHALEHILKAQVVPTLKEWRRLLKPGALAVVVVPDLVWCVTNWLNWQTNDWHMDTIFGHEGSPGQQHGTGFTHKLLRQYAEEAGLVVVEDTTVDSHGQPSIRMVMRKP